MRRLSLIVVGAAVLACGQPPAHEDTSQAEAREPIRAEHAIMVQLEEVDGDCVCTHPDDGHQVEVKRGDLVKWTFTNDCAEKMEVGIANFRIPERWKEFDDEREEGDRCPLEEGCTLEVKVAPGKPEKLVCHIKDDIKQDGITWKYDIVRHGGKVLVDPEIEIPRSAGPS